MTEREFCLALSELGCSDAFSSFLRYAQLLEEWNAKFNLTAIEEREEVYEKHFMDCLIPLTLVTLSGSVCDVGSGAGFPGLVWAIARPELSITLIEPTGKRCTFLEEVKRQLKLSNVTVLNRRAEDCRDLRESFDAVTARAVANLSVLSELCVPLVKIGGRFVPLKGPKGEEELKEAQFALNKLGCSDNRAIRYTLSDNEVRNLIVCEKRSATPGKYPRNYGQIKKSPLKAKQL